MSFLIERALAIVYENSWFVERLAGKGVKEPITLCVAFAVCRFWDFDALSVILVKERTQLWGHLLTAAIVAGGSKASIKLFHDVLGMQSTAEKKRQEIAAAKRKAEGEVARAETLGIPVPRQRAAGRHEAGEVVTAELKAEPTR
jgi:hypothetical protein